jgi:glutamate dehydrogenase
MHKKPHSHPLGPLSEKDLTAAIQTESQHFKDFYIWLEKNMPAAFFEEILPKQLLTITHNLMSFNLQGNFVKIDFEDCAIVLCLNTSDADILVLKNYTDRRIRTYQTYVSHEAPPLQGITSKLRIAILYFAEDKQKEHIELNGDIFSALQEKEPKLTRKEFDTLVHSLSPSFVRILTKERLIVALSMFFRAKTDDLVQYEVRYNEDWDKSSKDMPSLQIVFAWRNTKQCDFLYKLSKMIYRHHLVMKRVNAAFVPTEGDETTLIMSLAIHGEGNKAAWEVTHMEDFLQEFATLKYFKDDDLIETTFIETNLLTGNMANVLRTFKSITHQFLLPMDPYLYSEENIEEALCRHPELTVQLCKAFESKFDPKKGNLETFTKEMQSYLQLVAKVDTGNFLIDTRRKNVLKMAMEVIHFTDKTNAFKNNKSSIAFRINGNILEQFPYDRTQKFPAIPFALFFIKGLSFIAFNIRFKDLSRGGVRTVLPYREEQAAWEKLNIFSESYNLAFTQQKKNKDIPEGGAKTVIFVQPFDHLRTESAIYKKELLKTNISESEIVDKLKTFEKQERNYYLYHSQRSFVSTLLSLVNCLEDGSLKAKNVLDYYKKPEYLYLGPDENMHNHMIEWIAEFSVAHSYKVGKSFISSKPKNGINHKEFGVTSYGVNVYMHKVLEYIGINPEKTPFTIKISGGPDGDVAGNQIYNLYKYYPKTAKLLAITDVSGTIYDPEGLDLSELAKLFKEEKSIRFYPPEKLSNGGLLLDLQTKREQSAYSQETLCYRKEKNTLIKDWLSGNETQNLFSRNLHQVVTDIFIPCGGRPRTLNGSNWENFLDPTGKPTSKAIVEGANLYLTPEARIALEDKGVLIIKDSSANKGGVMCSSLEVLSGLLLSDAEFFEIKPLLMKEVLNFIKDKAESEGTLLLSTKDQTGKPLTEISEWISTRINTYTYQILDYLEKIDLPQDLNNPMIKCLLDYMPPLLATKYKDRILTNIPPIQQKAMISCHIASKLVYSRGLLWSPSIVDVLPLVIESLNSK